MAIPAGWITGVALKLPSTFPSTGPAAGVCLPVCLSLSLWELDWIWDWADVQHGVLSPWVICGAETVDGGRHGDKHRWMIREVIAVVGSEKQTRETSIVS